MLQSKKKVDEVLIWNLNALIMSMYYGHFFRQLMDRSPQVKMLCCIVRKRASVFSMYLTDLYCYRTLSFSGDTDVSKRF